LNRQPVRDDAKQWKAAYGRCTRLANEARDLMFKATSSKHAPWHIIRSDDKRRARLNCISHILDSIPYKRVRRPKVKLPKRSNKGRYNDQTGLRGMKLVAERY
jgi:polyphosphate kinase